MKTNTLEMTTEDKKAAANAKRAATIAAKKEAAKKAAIEAAYQEAKEKAMAPSEPVKEDEAVPVPSTPIVGDVMEGAPEKEEEKASKLPPLEQLNQDIGIAMAGNPLFAWQCSHGKMSERVKPSVASRLSKLLGFPASDCKALSGQGAAILNRLNGAGMLMGKNTGLRLIFSGKGASESKLVSTSKGSAIGDLLHYAMQEAIDAAVVSIKAGEYPFALLAPISAKECGAGESAKKLWARSFQYGEDTETRWVLNTQLATQALAAFGIVVGGKNGLRGHQVPPVMDALVKSKGEAINIAEVLGESEEE